MSEYERPQGRTHIGVNVVRKPRQGDVLVGVNVVGYDPEPALRTIRETTKCYT